MPEDLTVMIVDSSARAHALSAAYEKSQNVKRIIVSPGNDFIKYKRQKEVLVEPGKLTDPQSFLAVAQKYKPDLVDVCQDDALAAGTVDLLQENGFTVFGPTKAAARLEWDKEWSRNFMAKENIPHPDFVTFTDESAGIEFARAVYKSVPGKLLFIKAAGLCAGKGAIPARNLEEAITAIETMKSFGPAGKTYLIETGMVGEEASFYAFSDGLNFRLVKSAQDNKRLSNFDEGPNTGGMGAVAPAGGITPSLEFSIASEIISPAIRGMHGRKIPYCGVLYAGIMVVEENGKFVPKVVEFNSRLGAPEAEVVVPGIQTPMDVIAYACINQKSSAIDIKEDDKTRVCVVGAVRGYPDNAAVDSAKKKNLRIYGLDEAMRVFGVTVYGAGIKMADNKFYVNGGRLFSLVAEGFDIRDARAKAMHAMSMVSVEGNNLHYRTDIGWRDMERYNGQR